MGNRLCVAPGAVVAAVLAIMLCSGCWRGVWLQWLEVQQCLIRPVVVGQGSKGVREGEAQW
jgi:hypothetical protein